MDDLTRRRHDRDAAGVRRTRTAPTAPEPTNGPPAWVSRFVIPRDACEPCAAHHHHRCQGVNLLLDPIPDCPCDCGDRKDPMRLSLEAWADMSVHAPEAVWIAAMFERQRAAGIFMCTQDEHGAGLRAWKEPRR